MELIKYIPRNELIMLTFFGEVDKSSPFYAALSDEGYFDSDYSENYLLNPPRGVKFDPSNWKDFDHYAMLGLKNVRWRATANKIKYCYRQRLLAFHPDKKRNVDESFLALLTTCLNKSFEVLGNPIKRRSYDSVDPSNDDSMPISAHVSKSEFYSVYGQAFESNSKWSAKQPVPKFGDENSSYAHVIAFYDFWYAFDSWREFSYYDKEDKEQGENRYQRRIIDKENKADRVANKKKETLRIRKVVDDAYQRDIRVKLYQQQQRREKEEMRKLKKHQQRSQNGVLGDSQIVLSSSGQFVKERLGLQQNVQKFKSLNVSGDAVQLIVGYVGQLSLDVDEKNLEKLKKLNMLHQQGELQVFKDGFFEEFEECRKFVNGKNQDWTVDDLHLLTKAVNLFPNGYKDRWQHIARFVNSKGREGSNFSVKNVVKMAKDLESFGDATAFFRQSNSHQALPDSVKKEKVNGTACVWSPQDQKVLEQALKTYPSSTSDRWDKIAGCLTNKSKAECIDRCKEILKRITKPKK